MDYMADEYKKAESNVGEGKKRYSLGKMGVLKRAAFLLLPGIYLPLVAMAGDGAWDVVAACFAPVLAFFFSGLSVRKQDKR